MVIIFNLLIYFLSLLQSDKITTSSETFGDQETLELMDILTQYLGRELFILLDSLTVTLIL